MAAAGARGIQSLVLDAAPLLTQARIAGLADKYYIPPSVPVSYTHLTLPTKA